MDYRHYLFSAKEYARYTGLYLMLDAVIAYLFFNDWRVFFLLLPFFFWFLRGKSEQLRKKRAERMKMQFLDGIQMAATSLQAGYSVENAFRQADRELAKLYAETEYMVREFHTISTQMGVNRTIESLLMDLGVRSGIEDIQSFAEVFLTAKRTGGDLLTVIQNTVSCIRQKQETLKEIETCLAGKVMEQNIMSLVPVLILAYVRLTSPEFLFGMYGNPTGVTVMTVCFIVYVLAYLWGKSIIGIEV